MSWGRPPDRFKEFMNDQIEKLAKELYIAGDINTCPSHRRKHPFTYSKESKRKYQALAKFVLERELEARLEEVNNYGSQDGSEYFRIKDITNQLQQLRAIK